MLRKCRNLPLIYVIEVNLNVVQSIEGKTRPPNFTQISKSVDSSSGF